MAVKNSIHIRYLIANERDNKWGLIINSVGFQCIVPGEPYPPQNHPTRYLFRVDKGRILNEYQLLYITKGEGSFTSDRCSNSTVKEGDMFLLFPNEWHSYKPDTKTGWNEYWIGFSGKNMDERFNANFFDKKKPILNVGLRDELVSMYLQAINVAKEQKKGYQQLLAGIVDYLLGSAYLLSIYSSSEDQKIANLITKAKFIILENLSSQLSLEEISQKLNISYSWFRKTFKKYTGFSPQQYIMEIKMQKAKELLTNSDMSISDIAFELGFDNPNYFYTVFKNKTKTTPLNYRDITQGKYLR